MDEVNKFLLWLANYPDDEPIVRHVVREQAAALLDFMSPEHNEDDVMQSCQFCGSRDDVQRQDMGEQRTMDLCTSCRGYIERGSRAPV